MSRRLNNLFTLLQCPFCYMYRNQRLYVLFTLVQCAFCYALHQNQMNPRSSKWDILKFDSNHYQNRLPSIPKFIIDRNYELTSKVECSIGPLSDEYIFFQFFLFLMHDMVCRFSNASFSITSIVSSFLIRNLSH